MPKIEVNVEELVSFILRCANTDWESPSACKVCPVRKECNYYYTRSGESGALAGVDLDQ